MLDRSDLLRVAKRVVWFKQPEDAIKDVKLFLAHVMTYGTLTDIATTLRYFSEDDFKPVIMARHYGPASWSIRPPFMDILEREV